MHLISLTFNPFGENTYLLIGSNKQAVVIDPGMSSAIEEAKLLSTLKQYSAELTAVWLTHSHIDHVIGLSFVLKHFPNVKYIHAEQDRTTLKANEVVAPLYGFHAYTSPSIDREVVAEEGYNLTLGDQSVSILEVSGHSQGHLVFYIPELSIAIVGDTLFQGSVGRWDLPGGNQKQLFDNIRQKLLTLPHNTQIYPGHGPSTTIGQELMSNPFFR